MSTFLIFLTTSTLALRCFASTTLVTDDASSQWSYSGWSASPCGSCTEQPDPSQAFDGTWHESTGSGSTASLSFTGTTAIVYGINPANPDGRSVYGTNITIYVNGAYQATYIQDNSILTSYQYNVVLGQVTGDASQASTLEIVNNSWEGTESVVLLDYVDVSGASSSSSAGGGGVIPPFTTTTTTPSTSRTLSSTSTTSSTSATSTTPSFSINTSITTPAGASGAAKASSSVSRTTSQSPSSSAAAAAPATLVSKKSMTVIEVFVPIGIVLVLLSGLFLYLHRQRAPKQPLQDWEGATSHDDNDMAEVESQNGSTLYGGVDHDEKLGARTSLSHASNVTPLISGPAGSVAGGTHRPSNSWGDDQYAADLLAGAEAALSPSPRFSTVLSDKPASSGGRPSTAGSNGVTPRTPKPRVVWHGDDVVRDSGVRFGDF